MKLDAKLFDRQSYHESNKGKAKIHCLNSYVRKACWLLDGNGHVLNYSVRSVEYRFFHPKANKFATNAFDFDVHLDDERKLIQCVPDDLLRDEVVVARIEAMEAKAEELDIPFEIWGEKELFGTKPDYRKSFIQMYC